MTHPQLRQRLETGAVWATLVVLLGWALIDVGRYGRNIPLAEDWNLVPPLTGDQPDFWSWVWAQNNEHRLPLARLANLGLLHLTHDFRSGMVANIVLLGLVAAAFVLVARRVRGRTSIVDAFFPIVLLNLGNWENMFWGWQLQFVIATALVLALLALVVAARLPLSTPTAVLIGGALVLLPFAGGSALPMIPAVIAGLVALVLAPRTGRAARSVAYGSMALSVVCFGLYFVGWERPWWYPDNPGPRSTASTTAKLFALGWGPVAEGSWTPATLGMAAVLGSAVLVLGLAILRSDDRRRAIALGCFFGGALVVGLAVGYGRAGLAASESLPDRYALLVVPALFSAWFAWQLFGPPALRRAVHAALLLAVVVLLPFNVDKGHEWRDWYTNGMRAVERDIAAGATRDELVARHGDFLLHWDDDLLARNIERLREDGNSPFERVPPGQEPRRVGPMGPWSGRR